MVALVMGTLPASTWRVVHEVPSWLVTSARHAGRRNSLPTALAGTVECISEALAFISITTLGLASGSTQM